MLERHSAFRNSALNCPGLVATRPLFLFIISMVLATGKLGKSMGRQVIETLWIGFCLLGFFMRQGEVICPSTERGKMEPSQVGQEICIKRHKGMCY